MLNNEKKKMMGIKTNGLCPVSLDHPNLLSMQ